MKWKENLGYEIAAAIGVFFAARGAYGLSIAKALVVSVVVFALGLAIEWAISLRRNPSQNEKNAVP